MSQQRSVNKDAHVPSSTYAQGTVQGSVGQAIEDASRFPAENPYPVLRIRQDGIVLYSNAACHTWLRSPHCSIGHMVSERWHQLVIEILRSGQVQQLEEQYGDNVLAFAFVPIIDQGYVNVYGSDITQRARAEALTATHLQFLGGLNQILSETLRATPKEAVDEICVTVAETLTDSPVAFLVEKNEQGLQDITISQPGWEAGVRSDSRENRPASHTSPIHELFSRVLQDGASVLTNDPGHPSRSIEESDGHPPLTAFLGVPLFKDGVTIGLLAVANSEKGYAPVDQTTLEALAPVVVQALLHKRTEHALMLSRRDLARAQTVGQIGNWRLNVRQNVLEWSAETYRLFGVPEDTAMTYETFLEIVHPDDRAAVDAQWTAALNGAPYDIEHRILVNGQTKWVREQAELEFNATGVLQGGFGTVQDVTRQKQLEHELRSAKDQLERLVEVRTQHLMQREHQIHAQYHGIPIPVLTWQRQNGDFVLIDYNEANEQLTQGKIKEYLDVTARTFFRDKPEMLNDLERCYTQQTTFKRERFYTLVTTGETKYLALTFNYTPPDLVLIHSEDITERRALESALHASEERYRRLFLSAREGIVISNPDGKIQAANPAATRILGYPTIAELEATPIDRIYDNTEKRRAVNQHLSTRGYLDNIELVLRRKDGTVVDVLASMIRHTDQRGSVTHIESIFTDISERKQRERALQRQLMKFQFEEGNMYLDKNDVPTLVYEGFRDLIHAGYEGVVLSRTREKELQQLIGRRFTYYYLAQDGLNCVPPDITRLQQTVDDAPRHIVLLLDRLDYLKTQLGFPELLRFIYWLRDITNVMGNIGLIAADPNLFTNQELHILTKETLPIVVRDHQVSIDLFEILRFVHRQNGFGVQPKYADVQQYLGVSKPTASKRIQQLVEHGYIQEYTRGSRKCLQLSYAGMQLVAQA